MHLEFFIVLFFVGYLNVIWFNLEIQIGKERTPDIWPLGRHTLPRPHLRRLTLYNRVLLLVLIRAGSERLRASPAARSVSRLRLPGVSFPIPAPPLALSTIQRSPCPGAICVPTINCNTRVSVRSYTLSKGKQSCNLFGNCEIRLAWIIDGRKYCVSPGVRLAPCFIRPQCLNYKMWKLYIVFYMHKFINSSLQLYFYLTENIRSPNVFYLSVLHYTLQLHRHMKIYLF